MIKVILDTNFLVYCAENKIDYKEGIAEIMTEGYELVVPEQVVAELSELAKNAKKLSDRTGANLALKILEYNHIEIIKNSSKYADEAILNLVRIGSIVATLDLELRKKLKNSRKIVIKGIKKVAFE